ncbi:MAG: hypothetical protein GZ091_05430 [Paludibacter sp.]|nr:hypothetical protein [Paludibacter sp.]
MKKQIITILAIFLANLIYGQKSYVQGYFVTNNGEKTECFIENKDWESSPKEIFYKLTDDSKPLKIFIDSISLFEIPGYDKYICKHVQIDKSSEDISNLSPVKNPVWQTEKLALKVLAEGKASLYMYSNPDITRFFYAANDSAIRQLVYKSYQVTNANGTSFVATNNNFRQQLFVEVNNPTYKYDLSKLNYEEKELKTYFEQYNAQFETTNASPIKAKVKRDSFKAAVMVGINHSRASYPINSQESGSIISPMFGVELEYTLPFFNNKWSFIVQPVYNLKISEKQQSQSANSEYYYHGIDIPLGVRYRYSVNNKLKINATSYLTNRMLSWSNISDDPQILGFGIGVDYNNLGIELKYTGTQDFFKYKLWYANYNVISLGFKYRLVDLKTNR